MLSEGVRKSDCVARLGGDEFGILLERADEASALETAQRLVDDDRQLRILLPGHVPAAERCHRHLP